MFLNTFNEDYHSANFSYIVLLDRLHHRYIITTRTKDHHCILPRGQVCPSHKEKAMLSKNEKPLNVSLDIVHLRMGMR